MVAVTEKTRDCELFLEQQLDGLSKFSKEEKKEQKVFISPDQISCSFLFYLGFK